MLKKASVIFTTYNQPEWLQKVLWGYECQSERDFEIVIADDGSGDETRDIIKNFQKQSALQLQHVWHPDEGYQKCPILNKAIIAAESDYLIFSDGDCIPRKDFVQNHLYYAEEGYFLSGGTFRLPMDLSEKISREDIRSQNCFTLEWLYANGLSRTLKSAKLIQKPWIAILLNFLTPTSATWNGHNASCWKKDAFAINGFNEEMHYGGQDREFGERLRNYGLKSKQIRYSAVCIHLEHGRPYKTRESIQKNQQIRKRVRQQKRVQTEEGLNNHLPKHV